MWSFTNPTALDIIDTAQFHLQVDGVTFDIDHALEALNQGHSIKLNPPIACQPALVNGSFGPEFIDHFARLPPLRYTDALAGMHPYRRG